jgi:hypothetical protein
VVDLLWGNLTGPSRNDVPAAGHGKSQHECWTERTMIVRMAHDVLRCCVTQHAVRFHGLCSGGYSHRAQSIRGKRALASAAWVMQRPRRQSLRHQIFIVTGARVRIEGADGSRKAPNRGAIGVLSARWPARGHLPSTADIRLASMSNWWNVRSPFWDPTP